MKFLIVLIACLAIVLAGKPTEQQMEIIQKNEKQCGEQEGITNEQATALRSGNFDDQDPKIKCFASCMMEKIGLMVDGQLKPDVMLEKMGDAEGADTVKALLAKCGTIKGADKCDTAYQYFQCFHKNRATGM
ncbi:general odorant-binding protein 56d-like [Drosophila innubila]|uniref:general odorant-binding protein 56d-like n=1 Tax=Drosophila innubila TaxID=198719 RepID=UPI00148CB9B1|nr:general odorant-binding protein 56d-like [Drosophila innubila]